MKTFTFDENGNLSVCETFQQEQEGEPVEGRTQREIEAAQVGAHLPMFDADMTQAELAQAHAIIAAQGGA
jgi:hypothetical protein